MVKSNNYSAFFILMVLFIFLMAACKGKAWDIEIARGTLEKEGYQVESNVYTPGSEKNAECFNATGAEKAECFNVTKGGNLAQVCIWTFSETGPGTFGIPQESTGKQPYRLTISRNRICVTSIDYSFSQSVGEALTRYDKYYTTKEN